jgi:gliding motility-associated-like protein
MKKLFTLFAACTFFLNVHAEHITGGDFTVQHVSGNTFRATLTLYRDCASFGANFDSTVEITVFDKVTNEHLEELDFVFVGFDVVVAELGNSCFTPDICLEFGIYETEFELPDNPNGYYLTKERCCRNFESINITPPDVGFVFTLDIPDPALENSSPMFNPYPTEGFLCVNALSVIDFGATDEDGDSLVYSFTEPLQGASSVASANPPIATSKPYLAATWGPGYSTDNQVGGVVAMTIDPQTGIIEGQPTALGIFTLAVKVEEFRDGVKIGEIRREIQLESSACDVDVASVITTADGMTEYNVYANTEFCIEITANDANEGDILFLSADGELIDGTVSPVAQFEPVNGVSTVTQTFCWAPLCDNVGNETYVITFTAFSEGCAPEVLVTTLDVVINVILDDNLPTELTGPLLDGDPGKIIDLYDPSTHCFDFVFTDLNEADSITVTASSEIFDLPNSETLEPDIDQGQIKLPYCWNVDCVDVRDEPYFVDFEVITTNCLVQDTAFFSVPIFVIVPENEPTTFAQPAFDSYTFEFYSADTFCVPVNVFDENFFDTLNVTASSPILELVGNPATFEPLNGTSLVEGNLCWVPQCSDVRPEPYTVTFRATSNSCKTDDEVIKTIEIFLTLPPETAPFFDQPGAGFSIEHIVGDDPISFPVIARDIDPYDTLTLTATSTAFDARGINAVFEPFTNREVVVSQFLWGPDCPNIDDEPYIVTFEVNSRSCQKNVTTTLEVPILVTTPTKGEIEPIQNVFTPNGDNKNDTWTIENKDDVCLLNFKTIVFDRWGREVYRSNDPAFQWDGVFSNGNKASNGTYFRIIEYFYRDAAKSFAGDLQILE